MQNAECFDVVGVVDGGAVAVGCRVATVHFADVVADSVVRR